MDKTDKNEIKQIFNLSSKDNEIFTFNNNIYIQFYKKENASKTLKQF